jgi:hypothetical protein
MDTDPKTTPDTPTPEETPEEREKLLAGRSSQPSRLADTTCGKCPLTPN